MLVRKTGVRCREVTVPAYCTKCGKQMRAKGGGNERVKQFVICNRCKSR